MDIPCKYYFDLIFVDERPQATLTLDGKFFHGAGATATDAVNALANDLRLGGYAASPSSDMSYITVSFDKPNAVTRAAIREARIPKRERGIKFVMTPFGYKALYGIFNGPYLSGEGRTLKSALYSVLKKIPKDDVIAIRDDWIQRNLGVEVKVPTGGIKAADLLSIVERGKGSMKTESPGMMTKDRLSVLYKKFLDKILATLEAKNHDYTGSDDPFANFRASSVYGIDPRKGILLRAQDKFMRINTHIEKGALMVEGEGVEDAIADVIGYMLLMYGMEVEAGDGADKSQSEV